MSAIKEHGYAVVIRDLPDVGLRAGDVGVVVDVHLRPGSGDAIGYILETFTVDGEGIDTFSVPADAVRATTDRDMASARPVAAE